MTALRTRVWASEPLMRQGLVSYFRDDSEIVVLPPDDEPENAQVFLVATDKVDARTMAELRRNATRSQSPAVLITRQLHPGQLLTIVDCRVITILPRLKVTGDEVIAGLKEAAAGRGALPGALQSELIHQVRRLQREVLAPLGIDTHGLSDRETQVLNLLANGMDTAEIAAQLSYSERTVKAAIGSVLSRFNVRNRAHAVAYALRAGVI
jgi:DNA-binding NarL/FixJ family response regulator